MWREYSYVFSRNIKSRRMRRGQWAVCFVGRSLNRRRRWWWLIMSIRMRWQGWKLKGELLIREEKWILLSFWVKESRSRSSRERASIAVTASLHGMGGTSWGDSKLRVWAVSQRRKYAKMSLIMINRVWWTFTPQNMLISLKSQKFQPKLSLARLDHHLSKTKGQ